MAQTGESSVAIKRWIALLLLLLPTLAAAQGGTGTSVRTGSSLPSTCTVGQLFYKTSSTIGYYGCRAGSPNYWDRLHFDSDSLPWEVGGNFNGIPAANTYLLDYFVGTHSPAITITIPADCSGSVLKARSAATAETAFVVKKNGSTVCTGTFAIAGTTASWSSGGSATSLTSADELTVTGGGDATLAGVSLTLVGSK